MRGIGDKAYEPTKGKLPAALEVFPAHLVQFKLEGRYSESTASYAGEKYPVTSLIRDLNPDPAEPYNGRSIVRAARQRSTSKPR